VKDSDSVQRSLFDAAPALFLDRLEELRMELSDQQLIAEAIETNHAGVRKDRTLDRYRDHLVHYSHYLASVFGVTFYTARRKHVRMFMNHLSKRGGPKPHEARLQCAWCKTRGYPDGRSGPGWSPSYRKSYLAAIKFLYLHFLAEEDLPDMNPAALEQAPKAATKLGYTPNSEDVKKLLECPGTAKGRLLAHWLFYAPSRRQTFSDARWRDIDLDQGTWRVMGKGEKFDIFDLAPPLIRAFRLYRHWQLAEAQRERHDPRRPGRSRHCLRPPDPQRSPDRSADDQQDRQMARRQGRRRRPQIPRHPRHDGRPHLPRLPPRLPPSMGNHRAQREGAADRCRFRGLEARRHRDHASALRSDEIGASAGGTDWNAVDLTRGHRGGWTARR
jgi:site-specific recombinase XerD